MNLAHFTIRTRLRLGFGLILLLLFTIAATGLYEMAKSNAATTRIVQVHLRKIALLEQMSDSVHIVSRVVRSIALLSDPARAAVEREKVAAARARYDQAFAALREMPLDARGQAYVEEFKQLQTDVRPLNNRFLEMAAQRDPAAVTYLLDVANPATKKWQDAIRAFMDLQKEKSNRDAAEAEQAYESARVFMLGLAFVSLAGGILFAVWTTRSIVSPLTSAVELAGQVSSGDLSGSVSLDRRDRTETGALLRALNDMSQQLNGIVNRVREGAHTLTMSSTEIAQGNLDLSSRTEQQAGALQQTAASMEELAATVKNNADNVKSASALASDTAQVAAHGGAVVGQVVDVMHGIESSSARIVDIIDVIDGIAFQTNILALNAAVEAARAGEQGRGFAVVASEVRALAQRSATAAHEIKDLIHASVDQIKTGGTLVRDAGTTMDRIVGGIGKVSNLVSEIATATEQQAIGIEETHLAITELDRINQENTALVEEIAASAVSLKDEALSLEQVVSRFRLTSAVRDASAVASAGRRPLSPAPRRLAA